MTLSTESESDSSDASGSEEQCLPCQCSQSLEPRRCPSPAASAGMEAQVETLRRRLLASPFFRNARTKAADARLQARLSAAMEIKQEIKQEVADADGEVSAASAAQLARRAASGHASLGQVVDRLWQAKPSCNPAAHKRRRKRGGHGRNCARKAAKQRLQAQQAAGTIPKWTRRQRPHPLRRRNDKKSRGSTKRAATRNKICKGRRSAPTVLRPLPRPRPMPRPSAATSLLLQLPRPRPTAAPSLVVEVRLC